MYSSPAQTQSLPAWGAIDCKLDKLQLQEDPAYLSGDDTDCDSERDSDVLSREDQQLLASFVKLQRERHSKQACQAPRSRTTPVLIPTQSTKYVEASSKNWSWDQDDDDDDCDQCPCCQDRRQNVATRPAGKVEPAPSAEASDLIFDMEL